MKNILMPVLDYLSISILQDFLAFKTIKKKQAYYHFGKTAEKLMFSFEIQITK